MGLVDWWTLGIALFKMTTGKSPFSSKEGKRNESILKGKYYQDNVKYSINYER